MKLKTTVHLSSGTTLTDTAELDQEIVDQVEIFLKRSSAKEDITGDVMANVTNEMFNQMAQEGGKLTRLTVGPHFIFVSEIAAITYEVIDQDMQDEIDRFES